MVQAVINIPEETNRVLNIVKAKFGLKDKSQAIKIIVDNYETNFLEPELRPEFVEEIKKIQTEKFTKYNSIGDLERDMGARS
jgi:hypothetical protein